MEKRTIRPVQLAHFVLRTSRPDEMIEWWSRLLGAEVRRRDELLCFLSYDEEHHRLAILTVGGLEGDGSSAPGVDHVAFSYAGLDDLLATYVRLGEHGVRPYWSIHHGMTVSLYYRDPDGNRVELQTDALAPEAAAAFMRSATFAANPIGIPIDPDDLVARRARGEPAESLCAYPAPEPRR